MAEELEGEIAKKRETTEETARELRVMELTELKTYLEASNEKLRGTILSLEEELTQQRKEHNEQSTEMKRLEYRLQQIERTLVGITDTDNLEAAMDSIKLMAQNQLTLKNSRDENLALQLQLNKALMEKANAQYTITIPQHSEIQTNGDYNSAILRVTELEQVIEEVKITNEELQAKLDIALKERMEGELLNKSLTRELVALKSINTALTEQNKKCTSDIVDTKKEITRLEQSSKQKSFLLQQISQRVEPDFVGIEDTSPLFGVLAQLSMLLKSLSDDSGGEVAVNHLFDFIESIKQSTTV